MKKRIAILCAAALLLCALAPACAQTQAPSVILFSIYRQMGWGDQTEIGFVDSQGGLWYIEGSARDLNAPNAPEALADWLPDCGAERVGELDSDALFTLNSLIACVEDQGRTLEGAACDAGSELSYAVGLDANGARALVLLGVSGDSRFENTDPTAQALYLTLRQTFPQITSYFGHSMMGPAGFRPQPLMAFCGCADADLANAELSAVQMDCESGPQPFELDEATVEALRGFLQSARVVGKQNCIQTTGGSYIYSFTDADGGEVASFEFYNGLLVRPDGMYLISDGEGQGAS